MATLSFLSTRKTRIRLNKPSAALVIGLTTATLLFLPLVGCGKKGPNKAPGPKSAITSHRVYPAPDQ